MIPRSGWVGLCCLGAAGMLHALALVELRRDDPVEMAGGGAVQAASLGSAFADMVAGQAAPVVPETLEHSAQVHPVTPPEVQDAVDPVEPQTTRAVRPPVQSRPAAAQPVAPASVVPVPPMAPAAPPTLAALQDVPRAETPERAEPAKPPQPPQDAQAPVETAEVEPVKTPETERADVLPPPRLRPAGLTPPVKTAKAAQPPARQVPTGNAAVTAAKGTNTGSQKARSATEAATTARASQPGNAAESNYKGQVFRQITRARRGSVDVKGSVILSLTVAGDGRLDAVNVYKSSGSAKLDRMAVAQVKRAAPFPPPPAGRGLVFSVRVNGKR